VAVALAVGYAPEAYAVCAAGDSRIIGNTDFGSTIQWNLQDPSADFAYYFVGSPTINEGTFGDPATFRNQFVDLQGPDFNSTLDESITTGIDIGDPGSGTNGCPPVGQVLRLVALFSDRRGTTCVSVQNDAGTVIWNFDRAAGGSDLFSPVLELPVLKRGTMDLRVIGNSRRADGGANVTVSWAPPACNTDAAFALGVTGYDILRLVLPHGTAPDSGQGTPELVMGGLTANSATVELNPTPGADSYIIVRANLENSGTRMASSSSSDPIITDPGIATPTGPAKGKGKGLEKAPGQNR
jgi:hypothetical protein